MQIQSINPLNGGIIKSYNAINAATVDQKIQQTHKAYLKWKEVSIDSRAELMHNLANQLDKKREHLAHLMALEMGKPLFEGMAEIDKCAAVCRYYATHAAGFLKDTVIRTEAQKSYVTYQPMGVILAIMPWNFPFWQVFRFLAPTLMAGNGAVLKHASNVPGCAMAIEQLVKAAEFPSNLFHTLLISSKDVANVIAHPHVKAVTLTGSTAAGMQVSARAGKLLKKTVLELGGSDPYIILDDADLPKAASICVNSRLINNGQSCIAAKRFIVVKQVEKAFTQLFLEAMQQKKFGDPLEPGIDLGPMARVNLRNQLHRQVLKNIEMGAKCLYGGNIPAIRGQHAFYEPTILTGVKKGMPGYSDEMFGPVASIITARDLPHAIELANDSSFGLGAAVFTKDIQLGENIAATQLQAGSCFVNAFVKSDPRLPFGGINQSGYGRELGSFGIHEFVNIKTVYIGN